MGLIETQILISEGCLPESLNDLPYNELEISDNPHEIPELNIPSKDDCVQVGKRKTEYVPDGLYGLKRVGSFPKDVQTGGIV
jgi:hypothetical protein